MTKLPSWLRAALITAGQMVAATALVTLVNIMGDVSADRPVDWLGAARDIRDQGLAAATLVVVVLHRAIRPPEATYPTNINTKESS